MAAALIVRPEAAVDATQAAAWYESRSSGLGNKFLDALDLAVIAVAENPLAYPLYYREIRRRHIRHFPYAIFFAAKSKENAVVLAVLHLHRDPELLRRTLRMR